MVVMCNLAGAICYNVNSIASLFSLTELQSLFLVTIPGIIGGLLFVVGALAACELNKVWRGKLSLVSFLCIMSMFGAALYFFASFCSALDMPSEMQWWSFDIPFLVGSAFFCISGILSLWMWKCEQYGLCFAPQINKEQYFLQERTQLDLHEQFGCGQATFWQLPWLTLYVLNASGCVLDIGIVVGSQKFRDLLSFHCVLRASINLVLSHGFLLLCSAVHHLPKAKFHRCLMQLMRACLVFFTVDSWLTVGEDVSTLLQC